MEDMVDASSVEANAGIDIREVYFLILHFLSSGPCKKTSCKIWNELLEHDLLPRRYHAWYSRSGAPSGDDNDKGCSLPLSYPNLVRRYPHIQNDHLLKLLEQLILCSSSPSGVAGCSSVNGADISTLLGSGAFSLLESDKDRQKKKTKYSNRYLRWPHMHTDQVRGLSLREIGGGFAKHHRAPSVRAACYAIAKPSTMVQKMQVTRKLRGHQNAVYCAIFDRSGRYVITGSDDRLVKIWSTETAFCLSSCRGHEGDITDLAVSSNNALVASASNDFIIRVWRVPDGLPISVLKGHTGVVTAIAFSPRPTSVYHLLSSSDDGTCRIWDARYSQSSLRVYTPKPLDVMPGRSSNPAPNSGQHIPQILCCAYNASGIVFVTGSSDTCARVWNACRTNSEPEDPNQPHHEMDVLSGHENDVNYVQFSGFSASSKFSFNDNLKEDNVPKFKNSWFIHDNIVTCSRDGSAIIWIPRSRRSHVKVGRWIRAFHLKVPPPPIPPQPARGGPRRRVQPTPRGVNMIVWSLDNRFVLAAIMDCRICVWNASDGSLVHSLIGHNQSTFVLDVHPFNPRIAMSAGYDGKTIIWDIWEGTPVRIYETGRFKLVDGKFSPDGTSVVLSDEVGQIFIIATGQGESQKDAKYDQFFLGDYRPLVQDIHGNSLDQETQLLPYRRNIQDLLCDSSMIPYPEPYQNMYQRRRLGALGIEWRPSSLTFAVGPSGNINNGDYQMLPIVDLERWVESLEAEPVFIDAMEWEQENEAQSDDSDSEYNVTEEVFCEREDRTLSLCSSADQDCSKGSEDYNSSGDGLRRSKRKKYKSDVEVRTQLGRKMKRRNMDGHDDHATRIQRKGKPRTGKVSLKKKVSKCTPTRPQRRAAKNALTFLSEMSEASTDEEEEEEEDLDNCSSVNEDNDSSNQSQETETSFLNLQADYVEENKVEIGDTANAPPNEVQSSSAGTKRKLILRLPIRDPKKLIEKKIFERIEQKDPMVSPAKQYSDSTKANETHLKSWEQGQSSTDRFVTVLSENNVGNGIKEHSGFEEQCALPSEYKAEKVKRGEVETCLTKQLRRDDTLGASMDGALAVSDEGFYVPENENEHFKSKNVSQTSPSNSGHCEKGKDIYINGYEAVEQFQGDSALDHLRAFARKLPSLEPLANDPQVATCSGNGKIETCVRTRNGIDCRTETICQEYRQYEVINKVNSRQDGKTTIFNEKGSDVSAQDAENNEKQCHSNTVPCNGDLSKAVDKSVRPCIRKLRIISKRSTHDPSSSSSRRDLSLENQKRPDHDFKSNSNVHGPIPVDPADDVSIYGSSDNDEWNNKPTQLKHRIDKSIHKRSKRRSKKIVEDETLHVDEIESISNCKTWNGEHKDLNRASTSRLHHTRSSSKRTVTEASENGCTFYLDGHDSLHDRNPAPKVNIKLRFSGNKGENCNVYDLCPPDKRKSKQQVKKISWLMLSEHEEGYRYIPQLGDEVAYLRQGHAEYLDATGSQEIGPWEIVKGVLEAVEFCEVKGLKYSTFPGSGESCCKLTLEFSNPSSQAFGETFKLTLPELVGFPDFLVERTRYDASIERNWTHRDKCNVWWRNEDGDGGSWWEGRIIAVKAKSTEFSESPWERYVVQYKNDSSEQHLHSPWELRDEYTQWGNPQLDDNSRTKLLSLFDKIEQTSLRNQDKHGIQRLDQVSQKSDFLNRFPVPLSSELIKRRLENHYYRSLEAVKHDVAVMLSNAQSYFQKNTEVSAKVRRLSESIACALRP